MTAMELLDCIWSRRHRLNDEVAMTLPLFSRESSMEKRSYGICDWEDIICFGLLDRAAGQRG